MRRRRGGGEVRRRGGEGRRREEGAMVCGFFNRRVKIRSEVFDFLHQFRPPAPPFPDPFATSSFRSSATIIFFFFFFWALLAFPYLLLYIS